MTLGLTPEQQALSDAVGQFAGRHAPVAATRDNFAALADGKLPEWWEALVVNGFHAVHLPEQIGGQGGRLIDAACVLESSAKALLPGPLLPTVTAGGIALLADPTPAAESLLRELASGVPAAADPVVTPLSPCDRRIPPRRRQRRAARRHPTSGRAVLAYPAADGRRIHRPGRYRRGAGG